MEEAVNLTCRTLENQNSNSEHASQTMSLESEDAMGTNGGIQDFPRSATNPADVREYQQLVQDQLNTMSEQAKDLFSQIQDYFSKGIAADMPHLPVQRIFVDGKCQWPNCSAASIPDKESQFSHACCEHRLSPQSVTQVEMLLQKLKACFAEFTSLLPVFQGCLNHLKSQADVHIRHLQTRPNPNACWNDHILMTHPRPPLHSSLGFLPGLPPFTPNPNSSNGSLALNRMLPYHDFASSMFLPRFPYNCLLPMISSTNHTVNSPAISSSGMSTGEGLVNQSHHKTRNVIPINSSETTRRRRRPYDDTGRKYNLGLENVQEREHYRSHDERPPFTYIDLIRQAILESQHKALPLVDIYNWIQDEFIYYRKNQIRWKNAVRHNLSLHKCFQRLGEQKGGVWIVNEAEFSNRRPHRTTHRPQGQSASEIEVQMPNDFPINLSNEDSCQFDPEIKMEESIEGSDNANTSLNPDESTL